MGEHVSAAGFSDEDFRLFSEHLPVSLRVLADLLAGDVLSCASPRLGLELELDLVDSASFPSPRAPELLELLADPTFVSELARFNVELNVPPLPLWGDCFSVLEANLLARLAAASASAASLGLGLVMVGVLPTVSPSDVTVCARSPQDRYRLLDQAVLSARGGPLVLDVVGEEVLSLASDSIVVEAAATSAQLHLQLSPDRFPAFWNAAQLLAGVQVALGANSPLLFGRRLWHESRVPLFEQSTDTRPPSDQTLPPRVWFGSGWTSSALDLFTEDVRLFAPLLPLLSGEDPEAVLASGGVPSLSELRLHTGTVYRWNRPVFDPSGRNLRLENRVLPAGPSALDVVANAAFFYGCVTELAQDPARALSFPFDLARSAFFSGAREGLGASLPFPGLGRLPASDLVLALLPLADEGLRRLEVEDSDRVRLLAVVEDRAATGQNGASWQLRALAALEAGGLSRKDALLELVSRYRSLSGSNLPVSAWPLP